MTLLSDGVQAFVNFVISGGAISAAMIPVYYKIRKTLDTTYQTKRDKLKQITESLDSLIESVNSIKRVQTTVVQETLSEVTNKWCDRGYVPFNDKQAIEHMLESYYDSGGNDLASYFWTRLDSLPVTAVSINEKGNHHEVRNNQ